MDRCFFSLCFSADVQQKLMEYQPKEQHAEALWHPATNLHLTLLFLGLKPKHIQQDLWHQALPLFSATPAFSLTFDHIAHFSAAKALFLGVKHTPKALLKLQLQLKALCQAELGAQGAPEFIPHVTLARKISPLWTGRQAVAPLTIRCQEVGFYHSVNTLSGVRYDCQFHQTLVQSK